MTNEFTPESERQRLQYLVIYVVVFYVANKQLWADVCIDSSWA